MYCGIEREYGTVPERSGTRVFLITIVLFLLTLLALSSVGSARGATCWVSPSGSDVPANGSLESPFKTIRYALGRPGLKYGDIIYLRGGLYREGVSASTFSGLKDFTPDGPRLCIWNYRDEIPIITGSEPANDWVEADRPGLVLGNYPLDALPLTVTPNFSVPKDTLAKTNPGGRVWKCPWPYPNNPPQQVFYSTENGTNVSLQQVGWSSRDKSWLYSYDGRSGLWQRLTTDYRPPIKSSMEPGSFFFLDEGQKQWLFIRLPRDLAPKPGQIEVSVRTPFQIYFNGVHVKGLVFEHSNTSATASLWPSVSLAQYSVFESCVVRWTDLDGLSVRGYSSILNCQSLYNGRTGLGIREPFCTVANSLIKGSNARGFYWAWHAGGLKSVSGDASGTVIENNEFTENNSPAVWFDGSSGDSQDIVIRNNYIHDNRGGGIYLEISKGFLVYNNVVADNTAAGITIAASSSARIIHNTVVAPAFRSAVLPPAIDIGGIYGARINSELKSNSVVDNVFVTHNSRPIVNLQTDNGANIRNNFLDYNWYFTDLLPLYMAAGTNNLTTVSFSQPGDLTLWRNLAGNLDQNSYQGLDPQFRGNVASGPYFYDLGPTSPLRDRALIFDEVNIDYWGRARKGDAQRYDIGAFETGGEN